MASDIIAGEVNVCEPPKIAKFYGYVPAQLSTGEVESRKDGKRADARRDDAREMNVVVEVEVDKIRK